MIRQNQVGESAGVIDETAEARDEAGLPDHFMQVLGRRSAEHQVGIVQ